MSKISNESEHRRGLVLGLTLAEALLLLLFLVLLALGARLLKAEQKLSAATSFLSEIQKGGNSTTDSQKFLDELAKIKFLENKVTELTEENGRMQSELANAIDSSKKLEEIKAAANVVDPNDSPKILKFGKDTLTTFGRTLDADKIETLSALGAELDSAPPAQRKSLVGSFKEFMNSGVQTSGHTWPPIIRLSAADDYFFKVGSAELTPDFEKKVHDEVVPQLLKTAREFHVDVIEVVGHTDEQPIPTRPDRSSNLDMDLLPVLRGGKGVKTLIPADNAGLGLTRAVAIVKVLEGDDRLKKMGLRILPLSGGQLIQTDETLSTGTLFGNIPERRRIEIRMRKSNQAN